MGVLQTTICAACGVNSDAAKSRILSLAGAGVLLTGISFATAPAAQAQQTPAASDTLEQVVVTGTRVIRDGYEAPTPLTVMSVDQIQAAAPANVADFVNQLPQLTGSDSPQTSRTSVSAGGAGINTLSTRNLGSTRTLVLLDGRRVVGAQPTGVVDINTFPQQLIERVDVVTGGASAAYGSDALAGVVNFVLDKDFTGVKVDVQGGITSRSDDASGKAALAYGTPFADGRGHLLLSAEYSRVEGIDGAPRDWARQGWNIMNNPDYAPGSGLPERLVLPRTAQSNQTPGGIITAGPLRGTAFGVGGVPYQFNYGPLVRDPWMQGGEWQANDMHPITVTLDPSQSRRNAFARLSYELTDNVAVYGEFSYGFSTSLTGTATHFNPGNLTIPADNAFIPAQIRAQMQTLGLDSLTMGTFTRDLPYIRADNDRVLRRYVAGINGNFDAFGTDWTWDAYYQLGKTGVTKRFFDRLVTPFHLAIDAVRDPDTGSIVCRSTRDVDPNNGCVPWNVFGTGVNSIAAQDYISDWSWAFETNEQAVMAASITGEPLSTWAGPVSLALGVEHRKESGGGQESAANAANESWVGNQAPTHGSYDVTEGFLETVIPLAKDVPFAQSLDFNGAVRYTDYSTSGEVITWKLGATWSPIRDVTFRATRSRDIRAPNRQELFAAGIFTGNVIVDPFRNNETTDVQSLLSGNPDLQPEKADTTGLGVVYQPSWAPGLSASVDYYNIDIKDVIATIGRQEVPDRCFRGEQVFCDALVRDPVTGFITVVKIRPTNFVKQISRGIDIEASYRLPMSVLGGELAFRALATHYLKNFRDSGQGPPTDTVGENTGNGPPDWKYIASATYDANPLRVTITGRGVSAGVYDNTNIVCSTDCPDSTSFNRTVNVNDIPGALYWDASITYSFLDGGADGAQVEAFLAVRNLFDKDPAIVATGPGGVAHSTPPCNASMYDCLGRQFRAGARLRW